MESPDFPGYLQLSEEEFKDRIERLYDILSACTLCGHECKVNRNNDRGICEAGMNVKISSVFPHFGEESPLVGTHGSGTIFLSSCNCKCVYCQNYNISHFGKGQ